MYSYFLKMDDITVLQTNQVMCGHESYLLLDQLCKQWRVQGGARGAETPNSEISPSKIMSRSPPKSYNGAASGSAGVTSVHSL